MKAMCMRKEPSRFRIPKFIKAINKIQIGDILTVVGDDEAGYEFEEYPNLYWYKHNFSLLPDDEDDKVEQVEKDELVNS